MDTVKFGAFLRELRKEKGLTQAQLAEQLNVTNRTVSRWETGVNLPDMDILIFLSALYGVDIQELLDGQRRGEDTSDREMQTLQKAARYSAAKETCLLRRAFSVVLWGMAALGVLLWTTLEFTNSVTAGGVVVCSNLVAFFAYCLCMLAFPDSRTADGYLAVLKSGFLSLVLSNVFVLLFFFGTGSYYNYGLAGVYYTIAIVMLTFFIIGIITRLVCRKQSLLLEEKVSAEQADG